jgi:DNA-binding PadR family transcriptional regulator
MSKQTTRIMVLGVVAYRQPISGYGIEKTLREWAVDRWTAIAPASIYQQLRSLRGAGLIEPAPDGTGRALDYCCTESGLHELRHLLLSLLNEQDFQPLSLIPLLHFTPSLAVEELIDGLGRRISTLDEVLSHEVAVIAHSDASGTPHVSEIFRLTWEGYRADRDWCHGFLGRLRGANSGLNGRSGVDS